jgi:putative membrane protein insertion efficiency factor|tara:strand:+ start:57910 stop:58131 length:222 start_codon:yes stop_codon:yes gene_type:complete
MKKIFSSFFLLIIFIYQKTISPIIPARCRYTPTCSEYSRQCFKKFNIFEAIKLSIKRILKCHPWGGSGFDPIP